ncbi:MAG: CocE/NonD family hydrolase [Chitinophagaceae bacterium]
MTRNLLLSISTFFIFYTAAKAQLNPIIDSIPMSDGRKLAADIYIPSGMSSGPVILIQTPYNRQVSRFTGLPMGIGLNLSTSNYIFVITDWRGFYGSRTAQYAGSPDRGRDGYSTVEWIAKQSWSNGKVGTWGPSALGKVQYQTARTNPPHLVCINPLVAAPQFLYQEYYPNGTLRTEYVEQLDQLGFGLTPMLMAHPYKDFTWTFSESANNYPDSIRVPCFMVGGWYDHNVELMIDFYKDVIDKSPVTVKDKHKILMGPWVHGGHGSARVGTDLQGQLSYPNAKDRNDTMSLKFFDFYLRNISNGWESNAKYMYYQMGTNVWETSGVWPPAGIANTTFYLHKDGNIKTQIPSGTSDSLTFEYDPANPSPTIGGCNLRNDLDQGPYDQKALVESRSDILVFSTPVLNKDVVLKGKVKVQLKVGSDRPDTDFDIRLTDVYPDGRSMLINDAVFRMRFRNGFALSNVAMMSQGAIYDCVIELPNTCLTFLAGHQIRIDISSSNYPKYNRNMNNGNAMYPGNSTDSLLNPLVAKNIVYLNSINSSSVVLPLLNYTSSIESTINKHTITLHPNPANSACFYQLNTEGNHALNLRIYDLAGRLVQNETNLSESGWISIADLEDGIYTVIVSDGISQYTEKLIKQSN